MRHFNADYPENTLHFGVSPRPQHFNTLKSSEAIQSISPKVAFSAALCLHCAGVYPASRGTVKCILPFTRGLSIFTLSKVPKLSNRSPKKFAFPLRPLRSQRRSLSRVARDGEVHSAFHSRPQHLALSIVPSRFNRSPKKCAFPLRPSAFSAPESIPRRAGR
jgi:hypothetical protein